MGFWHALGAPFRGIKQALAALLNPEGRRAWAVVLCGGCGVIMTAYAYIALYLERDRASYVFWLATEAFAILFIVISAITGLLVKRDIGGSVTTKGGTGSFSIKDTGGDGDNGDAVS